MIYSMIRPWKEGEQDVENGHFSALQAKHAGLDERISAERLRPSPDGNLLATLKKQKLKIKEALSRL